jgi:hypothetical protein
VILEESQSDNKNSVETVGGKALTQAQIPVRASHFSCFDNYNRCQSREPGEELLH